MLMIAEPPSAADRMAVWRRQIGHRHMLAAERGPRPFALFTASFDQILEGANLEVKLSSYRSPNTNAFVERFIQTLQQECLDYFVVFGQRHMDHLVAEMVSHYHEERPHQAKGNAPLISSTAPGSQADRRKDQGTALESQPVAGRIRCRERLGGRLKHYYRHAG